MFNCYSARNEGLDPGENEYCKNVDEEGGAGVDPGLLKGGGGGGGG